MKLNKSSLLDLENLRPINGTLLLDVNQCSIYRYTTRVTSNISSCKAPRVILKNKTNTDTKFIDELKQLKNKLNRI